MKNKILIFKITAIIFAVFILASCHKRSLRNQYLPLVNQNPDSLSYQQLYQRALTLWDVDFEELNIKTKFGKAHVLVAGPKRGEPIVLLHGMNASSTMWYPNIAALSKKHRIYAIDFLLEPSLSECNKEDLTTDEVVYWYLQIFDALQLKKVNLIGASRGGWLATNIAIQHPDRIKKMALLSPAQTFMWIPFGKEMFINFKYSMSPQREDLREVLQTLSTNVDSISQLYIDQYFRATTKSNANEDIAEMRPFSDEKIAALKMPVLVLIGDQDAINTGKSLARARKFIDRVTTKTVVQAGHFLSIDQSKKVNKELLDFIADE